MAAPPESVLANIAKHLDADASHATDVAMACATLAIVLRQSSQAPKMDGTCGRLCKLLSSEDDIIKANAMAALSAGLEVSDEYANEAVQSGAAKKLVQLLSATDTPPAPRVALNALGCIGALGEASEEGLESILSAGGVAVVLTFCTAEQDPKGLLESAVDTLCKLMSSGPSAKIAAVEVGLIPAMAKLLPAGVATDDVTVRSLLALGMVIDGDDTCRVQLASAPGAVQSLLALMKREDDADCQQISAGIFSELAKSPAAKEALAGAIKNTRNAS